MLKLDTLNQLKQLKNDIKANRNLALGTVKGSAHKFGFVSLDSGKDVFLPPDEMEKVIPGDRIEVEVIKDAKNKKVAKIERLVESPITYFCGKYITKGKAHFVEADIPGMNRWFFVPPQKRKNAKAKDFVKCKISQHPLKSSNAQAAVIEVIGTDQEVGIEREYAIKKYNLSTHWNKEIDVQLANLSEQIIIDQSRDRVDLSSLPFVTIDAETTQDLDDALFAEKTQEGWLLSVAIADPCAVIEENSAIEKELLKRATSIYFPGHQVPMLPPELSTNLCSLLEGKKRLAKVVQIKINQQGVLGAYTIQNAVINSHHKLSFNSVSQLIESKTINNENLTKLKPEVVESLTELHKLSLKLTSERQASSLVHQHRNDYYLELNEQQKIQTIKLKKHTIAQSIVEECMVAANRCIAKRLSEHNQPSLFIKHNGIREDRLETLQQVLNDNLPDFDGIDISTLKGFISACNLASSKADYNSFRLLISRQLEKSDVSSEATPHFGMGLSQYTTFTSPLRKAHDFLIHRQISSILANNPNPIENTLLPKLAENQSLAKGAAYDVEQWLKCQHLSKSKSEYQATILRIFSTGFQVQLMDNGIEGFVSTKEMDGKYSFNQSLLKLTNKSISFELEQSVLVKVKQIDWSRKQIQFDVVLPKIDEAGSQIETKSAAQ